MKPTFRLPALLAALVLASCTVFLGSLDIEPTDEIAENDSVMVTRIHGMGKQGMLQVSKGPGLASAGFQGIAGDELRAIKIPSGALYFSFYSDRAGYVSFPKDALAFNARPKTIIYVGDVYIERTMERGAAGEVSVSVKDEEATTVQRAKNRYPQLFSKYPYEKSLALKKTRAGAK